jgi:hypothetical protein
MPVTLLRDASEAARQLLERNPGHDGLPLSAQMAHVYVARLPNLVRAVELLATNELPTEARAIGRALVETSLKLAYILQRKVGNELTDNAAAVRDQLALDVWDLERIEAARMVAQAAPHAPGAFEASFLVTVATASARFKARVTQRNLAEMAEAAGMADDHRLSFGPMSSDAHGSIEASRRSWADTNAEAIRKSLTVCARYALIFLNLASQLLGDEIGVTRATELGLRLRQL